MPAREEPFDHLVLALGSVSNYLGLKNVQAEAFDFKTLVDAIRIRNHIIDVFERADRVFEDVFYSGTHGGEALSLAAAAAVLDAVADGRVLAEIEARGQQMLDGVQRLIAKHGVSDRVSVGGEPQRAVVGFTGADSLVDKSWVQQSLAESGVLFNGSMFICARHRDADVDRALDGMDAAFGVMAAGEDVGRLLKGPPVQPVFRTP